MEKRNRTDSRPPERSHATAPLSRHSAEPLRLLLPHGSQARGGQELVYAAHRRTRAPDERARSSRAPLRRRGSPDHHRLHRLRRLGVGRRPLLRRSARLQEAHLRNALRSRQRRLRAVRTVLRRPALPSGSTRHASRRSTARATEIAPPYVEGRASRPSEASTLTQLEQRASSPANLSSYTTLEPEPSCPLSALSNTKTPAPK